MTREEARKAAEVMLAYADGEEIEWLCYGEYVACEEPNFNWIDHKGIENYRIKPKEKFDPTILRPFDKVLVKSRSGNAYCWFADFISTPVADNDTRGCIMSNTDTDMVIPYNDETKHLVGTNREAPEFYRYWEE